MADLNSFIENDYYPTGMFGKICDKLEQQGLELSRLQRKDLSGLDEFIIRGTEVTEELAGEIYLKDTKILDVGCGLGALCRMLADSYQCEVTGIDLSEEAIETAKKLSELVGLAEKTEFIRADALNLPFEDGSFDIVWTQFVQMNIRDKAKFFMEIKRVLKCEGALVFYEVFKTNNRKINFPLPWAGNPAFSYLETFRYVDTLLTDLEFVKLHTRDQTGKTKQYLFQYLKMGKTQNSQRFGFQLSKTSSSNNRLNNLLKAIEENKIELKSSIYKKMSGI